MYSETLRMIRFGEDKEGKRQGKTCTYIIIECSKGMKNSNRQKVREGGGGDNQALSPLFPFIITASRLFTSYIFSATFQS
jgi:hypothetical protein